MLQRLTIAVAVAASSAAGWSQAGDRSAQDWLAQMSDAVRTQNYEGVVVYRTGDQLETMRVIHRFADGQEDERLISLTGDAREIVRRDGERRWVPTMNLRGVWWIAWRTVPAKACS